MNKISAIIITFNEEKNIERCLNSLENVADEVIVMDSFSKDKTDEICKKYNVRFYQHEFDSYFNQKNRAIDLASNDYILSLDADEFLSETLKSSILAIKGGVNEYDAYEFNILTFFRKKAIKHCGWYPGVKVRLWNKNLGKWEQREIHEKVFFEQNVRIKYLTGDLNHYSYYSIKQYIDKINNYSNLKSKFLFNKNKKTNFLKLLFKPTIKFLIVYFIKLGVLDGYYGFLISVFAAYTDFLIQTKIFELNEDKKNASI